MASYNELNALIDAYINRNGVQAITGQILNGVLKAMVEQLGRGYTIMGAAIPTTDPGTPDGPECYFASETGTYTDFDGLQVAPGELALLCYTPSDGWTKATIYEGFQEVGATIDGNVGTPSVGVSYADGVLSFDFHNMKGNPGQNGQDGAAAGFGTIGADITGGVGTPGVSVESSGPATAKNLQFHFTNLKGETGVTSVVATVDNTTGTPACTVSLVGQQLTLAFSGLKGAQGNTGVSADYPIAIINNLTTDDPASALSAAQGVVLDGKVSQLEAKVDGLIVNADYEVDTNAKRSKNYTIASGTKIVIKVTKTGGTGNTYSAYWIKSDENEAIFTGKDYGYVSDVLTVPNDATGVNIYMAGVAAGNTRNVKIYDASLPAYLTETEPLLESRVSTEEGKTATLEGKVSTLEGKAVNFTGTDGTNPGVAGFVPAPTTADKDSFLGADGSWKKTSDYFYNVNVTVGTNSQRTKNYSLDPGSKIVVRVSVVSGTSATINLSWIKSGGNETIISGYPMGYMTDILTVPNDATGISVFMTPAASGNVNKVEIWDATKAGYVVEKIGKFGFDYLNNRKMIVKTVTIPANNALMELVTAKEGILANLSGDIYAYISMTPKMADDKSIYFWNTEDFSSGSSYFYGLEMRQDKVFKVFSEKTFSKVSVPANTVSVDTEVTLIIFAIEPASRYIDYPLYGKKIMCFGDSLTQFKSGIDNKRYSDHLQEYSQATVKNAGIGGTRFAQRLTPSLTPTDNQYCVAAFDICNMVISWATGDYSLQEAAIESGLLTEEQQPVYDQKLALMKANPISETDIVTIMGGANDYRGGSQVGTEDQDTTDKGTIFGAVNAMVAALLSVKPTLQINFFSPLIMMFSSTVSTATSSDVYIPEAAPSGLSFPEYIKKIEKAVMGNHCPYFDMYWSLGFNVHNWQTFYGDDYSHPYRGFQVIAERMYRYLLQR